MSAICSKSYKEIDLVQYPNCKLIVTFEVQFHNSTFLPHGHHLAGSVHQPESSTKPKSEDYARDQYHTYHGVNLLTKSWLWQQLLVAWCVPNNHQCSIHSKHLLCSAYCLVSWCSYREGRWSSTAQLLHTNATNRRPHVALNQPYCTLSKSYGDMVSENTGTVNIVNIGNHPAKRVCMTVIHGLSQISYNWIIRVSCG